MKTKSHVLTLRVPRDLKVRIERMADEQGVSINQLAMYAFAREIAEMETRSYFQRVYGKKTAVKLKANFDSVIQKVKRGRPPAWDRLS